MRDPLCRRWASHLRATAARRSALRSETLPRAKRAAFPSNPRGYPSSSGLGQLRRPSVKSLWRRIEKDAENLCRELDETVAGLALRREERQVFRSSHRNRRAPGFRKCLRPKGLWPFPPIHRSHHNNKLYSPRFPKELFSREELWLWIFSRSEMEFTVTKSARRGESASNRRNSRCPRPRE